MRKQFLFIALFSGTYTFAQTMHVVESGAVFNADEVSPKAAQAIIDDPGPGITHDDAGSVIERGMKEGIKHLSKEHSARGKKSI